MRWLQRKTPRSQDDPKSGVYVCVVSVGDPASTRMVSGELLEQLVQATKRQALGTLDRYYRTNAWCPEIRTQASLEGPGVYFTLTVAVQPGETTTSMNDRITDAFTRAWDAAAQQLL